MKIELHQITIGEITAGYRNSDEDEDVEGLLPETAPFNLLRNCALPAIVNVAAMTNKNIFLMLFGF